MLEETVNYEHGPPYMMLYRWEQPLLTVYSEGQSNQHLLFLIQSLTVCGKILQTIS